MGLDVKAAAAAPSGGEEPFGVIAYGFMSYFAADGGIREFHIGIDGLAGDPEASIEDDTQQGVARTRIRGQPCDRRPTLEPFPAFEHRGEGLPVRRARRCRELAWMSQCFAANAGNECLRTSAKSTGWQHPRRVEVVTANIYAETSLS
jgi:hypothetical protein